ncbi:hypothetical protein BDW67DRAFT_83552 [Aspergillus spinulosporus]
MAMRGAGFGSGTDIADLKVIEPISKPKWMLRTQRPVVHSRIRGGTTKNPHPPPWTAKLPDRLEQMKRKLLETTDRGVVGALRPVRILRLWRILIGLRSGDDPKDNHDPVKYIDDRAAQTLRVMSRTEDISEDVAISIHGRPRGGQMMCQVNKTL